MFQNLEQATHERAEENFTDYIENVEKNNLSKALSKATYYFVLNDGSTDTGVNEQELVNLLFLNEGTPTVKCSSIETPKTGDAAGLEFLIPISPAFSYITVNYGL